MSDPVVGNIEHSGAVLWVSAVGVAIPNKTSIDFGDAWGASWTRVGFTKAPWTEAYTSEEYDIEAEEHLGVLKRRRIREGLVWETVLAEITADYRQLAASNQDAVTPVVRDATHDASESTGFGDVPILVEKQWGVEMLHIESGGNQQPIRIIMWKGTAMTNGNLQFSKKTTEYPGIPIQIKGLMDVSQAEGERLCLFQRITEEKGA